MSQAPHLRLGVNVDHVATIRNARGGRHPDPVQAAKIAIEAGADGITAHLREDRRHIRDDDMARLKAEIARPLNFEMAATAEMVALSDAESTTSRDSLARPPSTATVARRRPPLPTAIEPRFHTTSPADRTPPPVADTKLVPGARRKRSVESASVGASWR